MTNKEQALLEFCQQEDETITKYDIVKQEQGDIYNTPIGEFSIIKEDEVDKAILEWVENLFDEIGVEMFNNNLPVEKFIDDKSKETILEDIKEFSSSYMEDINYEKGDISNEFTRQQEEIVEFLADKGEINFNLDDLKEYVADKDNFERSEEIAEFFQNYESNVEEYIEMYAENYAKEYEDCPVEYIIENFGNDALTKQIKEGNISVNLEEVAEEIKSIDGIGILSNYDGMENEQSFEGETYYICKQDDVKHEKITDIAENFLEFTGLNSQIGVDDIMTLLETGDITREDVVNFDYDAVADFIDFEDDIDITDD